MTPVAMSAPRRSLGRRMWRGRWGYAFIALPAVLFAIFEFYPFVQAAIYSVSKMSLTGPVGFVGASNFTALLRDPIFWKALVNTLLYAAVVVLGAIGISLVLATLIYPLATRAKALFKMAFYLPAVASIVVVAMVWRWMYQPAFGLLNYLLGLVGLGPLGYLTDSAEALPSIMLMQIF
jgi:ABC-type sugar transport system permease subunit